MSALGGIGGRLYRGEDSVGFVGRKRLEDAAAVHQPAIHPGAARASVIVIDNDIAPGRVLSPRGSGRANVACCGTSRLIDFSWVKEDSRSVKGGT